MRDNPEICDDIEGQVRANADKLMPSRKQPARAAGRAAAVTEEKAAPAVKAPAAGSESELDIMVED